MDILPDQNHINKIRERLWCGLEYGQAAVMIGAGFSTNAEKTVPHSLDFPLWGDLKRAMQGELNLGKEDGQNDSEDALSLASRYEKTFGREALDKFLLDTIPDNKHEPGKLHKLLMDLPWSDVYTTNYDTLLERTRKFIHDRKYDLIHTPADIPGKNKPRIIKLHGSFPSHRPFIFTQKDYDEYPRCFAPFVNMVQQSIMENIFCLIGFSGEDPNFLQWIKWVKENLQESMPMIYLCGFFDYYSEGQKEELREKNIITIDLSPLFPKAKWHNERYSKGLEWLLLNLMYGEPADPCKWGTQNDSRPKSIEWKHKASSNLPYIPDTPNEQPQEYIRPLNSGKITKADLEDLTKICKIWKEERKNYPGWVICPNKNRRNLWENPNTWYNTEAWLYTALKGSKELNPCQALLLLYELNWRLEKSLIPLFDDWAKIIELTVKKFNPFPNDISIQGDDIISSKPENHPDINWQEIQEAWGELAFALMREARENHKEEAFISWQETLSNVVKRNPEWENQWFYERCLFHLIRLEFNELNQVLNEWQPPENYPFWAVKRAGIMTENGNPQDAHKIVEDALNKIRQKIDPSEKNYYLLSQEGCTLLILNGLKWSLYWFSNKQKTDWDKIEQEIEVNQARLERLTSYKCNPADELERLKSKIDKPLLSPPKFRTEKSGFYPGTFYVSYVFNNGSYVNQILPAFSLIRLFEDTGIPIRFDSEGVIQASKWIAPLAPLWAIGMMIRANNQEKIKDWLTFIRIVSLPEKDTAYLYKLLMTYVNNNYYKLLLEDATFTRDKLLAVLLFLSRLAIKLNVPELKQLLDLSIKLEENEIVRNDLELPSALNKLREAIFYTLPKSEIAKVLPDLLCLPVVNENQYFIVRNSDDNQWKDIFYFLLHKLEKISSEMCNDRRWNQRIVQLIDIVRNGQHESRKWAFYRLYTILIADGLTPEQQQRLSEAVWSKVDHKTNFPADISLLYESAFLRIPEPEPDFFKNLIKQYLLTNEPSFLNQDDHYLPNLLRATQSLFDNNYNHQLIDWDLKEIEQILDKIVIKVNAQDGLIKNHKQAFYFPKDQSKKTIELILEILRAVILPRLRDASDETKLKANELIKQLDSLEDVSIMSILPATLFINSDNYEQVVEKIRKEFFSIDSNQIKQAVKSLEYWLMYSQKIKILPAPPPDLLDNLVNWVYVLEYWLMYSQKIQMLPAPQMAINLLREGLAVPIVAKVTGFSLEQVEALQKNLNSQE